MELLTPTTARVIARYNHPAWGQYAAITENDFGKGRAAYIGFMPSDELMGKVLEDTVRKAGLWGPDQEIGFPLITKSGLNGRGGTVRYYLNYSPRPAAFRYPHRSGRDVLGNRPVTTASQQELPPWGVLIVVED
jgi:beta-galactosidase